MLLEDSNPAVSNSDVYALNPEQYSFLHHLWEQVDGLEDELGAMNLLLRTEPGQLAGVTSLSNAGLLDESGTDLPRVRQMYLKDPSEDFQMAVEAIKPMVGEIRGAA